jgi:hypothetical protein
VLKETGGDEMVLGMPWLKDEPAARLTGEKEQSLSATE